MNCPDIEDFLALSLNYSDDSALELLLHALQCPDCREQLLIALDSILLPVNTKPEFQSQDEIRKHINELIQRHSGWKILFSFIENLQRKCKSACSVNSAVLYQQLFSGADKVFGARLSQRNRRYDEIKFAFESVEAKESLYFWKMQLCFPAVLSSFSSVTIKIVDSRGTEIPSGTLSFLGENIRIMAGNASILLEKVQKGIGEKNIHLLFPDGHKSSGVIKFLPDL